MSDDPPPLPPPQRPIFWRDTSAEEGQWMHAVMSARPNMSALLTVLTLASHQMLGRARDLSVGSDSDRQLAVIFAHSACELHTEQIMKELVRHRAPALADVIFKLLGLGVHLENSRVRKVYSALTGDDPAPKEKQAEWWEKWKSDCHDLRNDVAHKGLPVSTEQAARAVALATAYIEHISQATGAAMSTPAVPT